MTAAADEAPVTIVLADDPRSCAAGCACSSTRPGLQVIAESAMIDATFRAIRARRPDVLVLDPNMPGGSSLEAIPRLVAPSPRTAIVALTMEDDPVLAREAARAGARGFVLKDAAKNDLVQAIGTAGPGGR